MRGIVVDPPQIGEANKWPYAALHAHFDRQSLRMWALFWDKIGVPSDSAAAHYDPDDKELWFLKDAGVATFIQEFMDVEVLVPEKETKNGSRPIDVLGHERIFLARGAELLFRKLNARYPGFYALGTSSVDEELGVNSRGIYIKLVGALPVPVSEVSLEEVLIFREKRLPELLQLRHCIDDIYENIISSPDRPLAEISSLEKIRLAVEAQQKVSRENKRITFRLSDVSAKFNLSRAATAFFSSLPMGITHAATLAMGAGANLQIGPSMGMKGVEPSNSPFRYIACYHKELFK